MKDKIVTIPNIITFFRIIGSILLIIYIAINGIKDLSFIILMVLILGFSDLLDGFIARAFNMQSDFGLIIDPIADKIFNWGIAGSLMMRGVMPTWVLLIAIRDVGIGLFSYKIMKKGIAKKVPPTIPAKVKMLFQSLGLLATLAFGFGWSGLTLIAPILMILAILCVIPEIFAVYRKYLKPYYENKAVS